MPLLLPLFLSLQTLLALVEYATLEQIEPGVTIHAPFNELEPGHLPFDRASQGRIGMRLASLIATLRTVMRLPLRQIQVYLLTWHGVQIKLGETVELLHRLKASLQPQLDALTQEVRASPAIQADETGWREDGINGYIWAVSIPSTRYYEYHHSRGEDVVKELIGEEYSGVPGSDF